MIEQLDFLDTKKLSFLEIQEWLEPVQNMVFECIRQHPGISDREIAHRTGLELATVCGRRNKLANPAQLWEHPLIVVSGYGQGKGNSPVKLWAINESVVEVE